MTFYRRPYSMSFYAILEAAETLPTPPTSKDSALDQF